MPAPNEKGRSNDHYKKDLRDSAPATAENIHRILLDLLERIEELEGRAEPGEVCTSLIKIVSDCEFSVFAGDAVITKDNTISDVLRHLIKECGGDKSEVEFILDRL